MSQMEIYADVVSADWPHADDEGALIARARTDRDAFSTLYRRHYRSLMDHVYRRTGDVHATEDIVADVFLTALRMLPRYRYRGVPVRFWLLRIATNGVNHWARRRRRSPTCPLGSYEPLDLETPPDQNASAELQRARKALLSLPPKYQTVLALRYFESLSVAEIATVIGCRVGTVKSRLARAREALRVQLTPLPENDHA